MKLSKNENARPRPGGEIAATHDYKLGVKHFGNVELWKRAREAVGLRVKDLLAIEARMNGGRLKPPMLVALDPRLKPGVYLRVMEFRPGNRIDFR